MTTYTAAESEPEDDSRLGKFSRRERPRYQSFELASGRATDGHDRSYLNELAFAGGIDGQAVLDIGCNLGYFCIQALVRNAASATGIDPDASSIRQAREIAGLCGLAPNYICGDFEEWDSEGRSFDTVLCLNVLHHLYDPVGAIRRMIGLAKRRIVIEFARPSIRDLLRQSGNPLVAAAFSAPLIVLGDPGQDRAMSRSFLFTGKAMEVLFNGHTDLFEPLILRPSPFKGRQVAVANRRQVGHLVVVAGPTSSGKSTLLQRLSTDAALRRRLGMEDVDWVIPANKSMPLPVGRIDGLVHHYDLLRPHGRSIKTYARDPRCDFFEVAASITVVTMMSPSDVLRRRLVASRKKALWRGTRLSERHRELYERYGEAGFLQDWYEQWFHFCDGFADRMKENVLLINDDSNSRFASAKDWRVEFARLGSSGLTSREGTQ